MKKAKQTMPEERRYEAKLRGFTPVLDELVKKYGVLTALVYGVVWRYCQGEDRVCHASLETIAARVGVSRKTVERRIKELCQYGFLIDMTPGRKNAPHVYADSGQARIIGTVEAKIGETESLTKPARSDRVTHQIVSNGQTQSPIKKEVVKSDTTTTLSGVVVVDIESITAGTPFAKISKQAFDKHIEHYGRDRVLEALDILIETYRYNPNEVRNPSSLLACGLRKNNLIPPENFIPRTERMKKVIEQTEAMLVSREAHKRDKEMEEQRQRMANSYLDLLNQAEQKEILARAREQLPPFLRGKEFLVRMSALEIIKKEGQFISKLRGGDG